MKYVVMAYDENLSSWVGGDIFENLSQAKDFAEGWHYEDNCDIGIWAVKDMYQLHKKWVKKE